ncbi:hypothetical protein [Stakelama flava]|uniref:hypothetical protein n=1 Tax=Stakelama flava TaxID=2860338 RepID=UPI001FEBD124|nr:hypothetical protein [Stakelama flava]
MLPANQRFGTRDVLSPQMDFRLILHEKLASGDCSREFAHQCRSMEFKLLARQIEQNGLTILACLVERGFRRFRKANFVIVERRGERSADRHIDHVTLPPDRHGNVAEFFHGAKYVAGDIRTLARKGNLNQLAAHRFDLRVRNFRMKQVAYLVCQFGRSLPSQMAPKRRKIFDFDKRKPAPEGDQGSIIIIFRFGHITRRIEFQGQRHVRMAFILTLPDYAIRAGTAEDNSRRERKPTVRHGMST